VADPGRTEAPAAPERRGGRRKAGASGAKGGSGAPKGGGTRPRQALAAWGFALPFLVLFAVFMVLPVISSLGMSLTDLRSVDLRNPFSVNFVGGDNYAQLLDDRQFRQAVLNTLYFVVVGVPLTMVLALAAAVGLNAGIHKVWRTFFRVGYYLPVVTSIVAVAVVWRFLLDDQRGMVNNLLALVGVDAPDWLNSTTWAMPALILMGAWRNLGFLMVIFLAGLQGIPGQLYEAAKIDGATAWKRFRYITVPMLRPTLLFGSVILGIGYLQVFEEPFVMTQGGPLDRTLTVSLHIYHQFGFGNYSYAAAMGYVLFVAIVVLTAIQFRLLRPQT
jgi:multiple sugar transport system permease protein